MLAVVSWNRWIEPYVDSGRELMVPRRLAGGERLWADVQFFHGPLGPYLAAIVEGAAGPSLPARVGLCAAVAAARRAALAISVAIVTAVFLRPGGWLFPFSFDVAIAVAALTAALVGATREAVPSDAAAGVGVLAALLARPEIGLAGAAALAFAARRHPRRIVPLALAPIAAAAAGYGMLSLGISKRTLVRDGWLALLDPPAAFRNVYRAYAGLDRPALRLTELALVIVVLVLIATAIVAAASVAARLRASGHPGGGNAAGILLVATLVAAAAAAARPSAALAGSLSLVPPLVRVVPLAVIAAAAWRIVSSLRSSRPATGFFASVPDAALWIAALFAARVLLAAGYVGPYPAFFLPLPLVAVQAGLFGAADRAAPIVGRELPRLVAGALVVFALFRGLALRDFHRGRPWSRVATPAGSVVLPEPVAGATAGAVAALAAQTHAQTLVGFPEAGFFAYVLGRRNPFREEQFFPGNLDADGERRAAALLAERPPDALLRANVLAIGEGAPAFGRDYYGALDAAARSLFRTAAAFGPGARPEARIGDPQFFVEIDVPAARRAGSAP